MKILCNCCNEELTEQGGLLFSPPDENGILKKYHICVNCFAKIGIKNMAVSK